MNKKIWLVLIIIAALTACSTTKNVPENKYLLNSIKVKHDTHVATSDLEDFIKQQPNSMLGLMIYNLAGKDTTKWVNRQIQKMGQAPVIYNAKATGNSATELQKELVNQGYLNVEVDTLLSAKGKKMNVTYKVQAGKPYTIRSYQYEIQDTTMARIMDMAMSNYFFETEVKPGGYYDRAMLELERERVNMVMRNVGYADFSKEYVYFRADTTLGTHQVDLFLDIRKPKDSLGYKRYKLNNVTVVSGINADELPSKNSRSGRRFFRSSDTTAYKGITIVRGKNRFLKNSTIRRNTYLRKGSYYSDYFLTNTYQAFANMGAVKTVNIETRPSPEDSLHLMDAVVLLNPGNPHWFRANLDGTNTAGDLGVAPSVSYQHQNLLNGGETFAIKLKGAYEFINSDRMSDDSNHNFYEYGVDVSLKFPLFAVPWLRKSLRESPSASTTLTAGITNQKRPEYSRQYFNFGLRYGWNTRRNQLTHNVDLLDVNYVRMPRVSSKFQSEYLDDESNPLLKESYKDQLISRLAYSGTYTRKNRAPLSPVTLFRYSVEVAGLLPRLTTTISGADREGSDHTRRILGVSYAEYFKAQVDFSQTHYFSKRHSIAYHLGLGIAQPYGNSTILPFERRFFGGGPNGVRGWSTRTLGPGSFQPVKGRKNFVNQSGDLSMIMSIEDRYKLTSMFEVAGFIDAGNVWTIKDYVGQEKGQFKFDQFYKEIALAYGVGLRLDLSFLLVRFDVGVRLYDPSREKGDRLVAPALPRTALHFGIGYPF